MTFYPLRSPSARTPEIRNADGTPHGLPNDKGEDVDEEEDELEEEDDDSLTGKSQDETVSPAAEPQGGYEEEEEEEATSLTMSFNRAQRWVSTVPAGGRGDTLLFSSHSTPHE